MNPGPAVLTTALDLPVFARGKVRDTYELADGRLLMVATDRISAFDVVLPNGIPDKGKVLTQLSIWWFSQTHSFQENHLVSGMVPDLPTALKDRRDELVGRFMIVRKAERIDFECVVRGYLAGSAWAEYKEAGTMAGEPLPKGLQESDRLPEPIFTPATKADAGHDENVTFSKMRKAVGAKVADQVKEASLGLYKFAADAAEKRGLILADTKFEFGLLNDRLILIDEALTPDSSRYWDRAAWRPGTAPPSFDKQFVRDWLNRSGWDHKPPGPELPEDVVKRTRDLYLSAYKQISGRDLFYKEKDSWLTTWPL